MSKKIIISGDLSNHRIAILDKSDTLIDLFFGGTTTKSIKSNIYLAKVTKVEASLQAAFVEYGTGKSGFLPFSEIHDDYHNSKKNLDEILKFISNEKKELNDESVDIDKVEFTLEFSDNEESNAKQTNPKLKIQDVIKEGQYMLVQVYRDERGEKGASLTTFITLPTKYCVFTPNNRKLHGVSRRIPDVNERDRLRSILDSLNLQNQNGLVVRTAAFGVSETDLKHDYQMAVKRWNKILDSVKSYQIGIIDYADSNIMQSIRDYASKDSRIIVDSEILYNEVLSANEKLSLSKDIIMIHRGEVALFTKMKLNEKINNLYKERVNLPSGGYLIINNTEALVAIDVNSGGANSHKNIEDTATKTNLEAVDEVCRQMILRDIGGLVIVDFIDMEEIENRKAIEMRMKDKLSLNDKARVQFTPISPFGLMEISRQRLRTSFIEASTIKCNHCSGTGRVFSADVIIQEVKKSLELKLKDKKPKLIEIRCSDFATMHISSVKNEFLKEIEAKYSARVKINPYTEYKGDRFAIFTSDGENDSMSELVSFHGLSNLDHSHGGIGGWDGQNHKEFRKASNNSNKSHSFTKYDNLSKKKYKANMIQKIISIFKKKPVKKDNKKHDHKHHGGKHHHKKYRNKR